MLDQQQLFSTVPDEIRVRVLQRHESSGISKSLCRHDCDDSVHTHGGSISPMSCRLWWTGNMSPYSFDILNFLPKARRFHSPAVDIKGLIDDIFMEKNIQREIIH